MSVSLFLRALGLALRSLFLQASWNFDRMQNLGFFLMVAPSLRRRGVVDREEAASIRTAHLELFNTHPYFAPLVAGTVCAEEEVGASREVVDGLKRSLMCSLAGIGDGLFWAHLRPLTALIALPAAILGQAWAPLLALAMFNVPHLGIRLFGAMFGLSRGRRILGFLQARLLTASSPVLAVGISLLAGFLAGFLAADLRWGLLPGRGALSAAVGTGLFLLLLLFGKQGLMLERLVGALSIIVVLGAALVVAVSP